MIIDELIAVLGYDVRGEGDLARFNRGIDQAERNARNASRALNAMGVAIGTFVGNMATMAVIRLGGAIGSLPGDVIATGREFEKLEATLSTIEGSSNKAKAALDWVQEFAKTTPYDLKQVADGFVRLRAYGLDPMSGLLESLGNASSAMGKDLMQGVEAIADAAQGENERLKEFGIRASVEGKKITYSWQQNGQEMTKTVTKNGTEIVKALTEIFDTRFAGAMEKQSKTLDGMISNLGDSWTGFLKSISERGIYEDVKSRLGGVMDTLDEWRSNGNLDWAAQRISDLMRGALRFGSHVGSQLATIGRGAYYAADGIVELISRVTGLNKAASAGILAGGALAMSAGGRGLMAAVAKRIPALGMLLLVDDIMTGIKGGDSYVGSLEGGQEAIDGLREKFTGLQTALQDLSRQLDLGLDWSAITAPDDFINNSLVAFIRELASEAERLTKAVSELSKGNIWEGVKKAVGFKVEKDGLVDRVFGSGENDNSSHPYLQSDQGDGGRGEALDAFLNFQGNSNKLGGDRNAAVVTQPITDNSQDNRNQSVSVTVNQTVTQATAAAGLAASATANAVLGAASQGNVTRDASEGSF